MCSSDLNSKEKSNYIYAIELILSDNKIKRVVIPSGKVIELGDVVYKDDEAIGYEVTLSVAPDSSGNTAYEYLSAAAEA